MYFYFFRFVHMIQYVAAVNSSSLNSEYPYTDFFEVFATATAAVPQHPKTLALRCLRWDSARRKLFVIILRKILAYIYDTR